MTLHARLESLVADARAAGLGSIDLHALESLLDQHHHDRVDLLNRQRDMYVVPLS